MSESVFWQSRRSPMVRARSTSYRIGLLKIVTLYPSQLITISGTLLHNSSRGKD